MKLGQDDLVIYPLVSRNPSYSSLLGSKNPLFFVYLLRDLFSSPRMYYEGAQCVKEKRGTVFEAQGN
jgi:hypothetical protein